MNEKPFFAKSVTEKLENVSEQVYCLTLGLEANVEQKDVVGKFFMLKTQNSTALLMRPISAWHVQYEYGRLYASFLIARKGVGTIELSSICDKGYNLGSNSVQVLGPIGNGFLAIPGLLDMHKICVVGGGIGVAPVAGLCEYLQDNFAGQVDLYASFKKESYGLDFISKKTTTHIATESGYEGTEGMLPAILTEDILTKEKYDCVIACGPAPMLSYIKKIAHSAGIKAYLCMERRMACGVGVCLGCNVKTTEGMKRCCVDGPVFDADTIIEEEHFATAHIVPQKEFAKVTAIDVSDASATVSMKNCKTGEIIVHDFSVMDSHCIDPDVEIELPTKTSLKVSMKNRKTGEAIVFKNPVVASSGVFGFGTEYPSIIDRTCNHTDGDHPLIDVSKLGAICSKGLTLEPRQGNEGTRLWETPSGLLNSIGLQNPGIPYFIEHLLPKMLSMDTMTIVNLSGSTLEDYVEGAKLLQATNAKVIELNISCPNVKTGGAAWGMACDTAQTVVKAVRDVTDKFLIVKLTPQAQDVPAVAVASIAAGADAISLCNSFSGVAIDIDKGIPVFKNIKAGFGGPAVRPIALRLVWDVATAIEKLPQDQHVPIFAIGGVKNYRDAIEFIMAGASMVEMGTAIFSEPSLINNVASCIEDFMRNKNYPTIEAMRAVAIRSVK